MMPVATRALNMASDCSGLTASATSSTSREIWPPMT
jgi:hypothetical protein